MAGLSSHVHWWNSGLDIMGVTDHFLSGFKDEAHTGDYYCDQEFIIKYYGPKKKPTITAS